MKFKFALPDDQPCGPDRFFRLVNDLGDVALLLLANERFQSNPYWFGSLVAVAVNAMLATVETGDNAEFESLVNAVNDWYATRCGIAPAAPARPELRLVPSDN